MRLLRAGLPQPQPDHDAAPADRPAPRDGAPAGRLAGAGRAARGVRVRRDRDLRRGRHLQARLPGGDRHGRADQGLPRPGAHATGAGRVALALARQWAAVERAARGGLRAGAIAGAGDAGRCGRRRAPGGVSDDLVPSWPANMPAPAPARLPATGREGAAAVYLPACINRIFGSPRDAPADRSLPEALVAVSAPRRAAGVDPARRGRPLLRDAVELEGLPRRQRADGAQGGGRAVALERGGSSARGYRRDLVRARPLQDVTTRLDDERRDRYERLEVLDSIAWVHDRLLPQLTPARPVGSVAVHPTCSGRHLGLTHRLEAVAAALADEVVVPAGAGCCGFAGDRGLLHPELPASAHCATRPPSWTAATSTRTCAATAPARSACSRRPASPTRRSCRCWTS